MSPFRTSLRYQGPWTIRLLTCHSKIWFETAAQASYRAWILSVIFFFCHYKILRQNSVQQNCTTVIFTFVPKLVRPCCVILGFCIIYAYPITLFFKSPLNSTAGEELPIPLRPQLWPSIHQKTEHWSKGCWSSALISPTQQGLAISV